MTKKEPWQMTQEEYVQHLSDTFEPIRFGTVVGSKIRWRGTERTDAKQKADILRGAPEAHRYWTRKALEQGKPVPAEVLKDYPELKAKADYTREDYDKDTARSQKVYREILAKTGSHKEAFEAENEIASEALRRYEAANPIIQETGPEPHKETTTHKTKPTKKKTRKAPTSLRSIR